MRAPSADQYPLADLKAFAKLFPDDPLTWFIQGFLLQFGLNDPEEEEAKEPGKPGKKSKKPKAEEEEAVGDDAFKLLYVRLASPLSSPCARGQTRR